MNQQYAEMDIVDYFSTSGNWIQETTVVSTGLNGPSSSNRKVGGSIPGEKQAVHELGLF